MATETERELNGVKREIKKETEEYTKYKKATTAATYGVSYDADEENEREMDTIRNIVSNINDKNRVDEELVNLHMSELINDTIKYRDLPEEEMKKAKDADKKDPYKLDKDNLSEIVDGLAADNFGMMWSQNKDKMMLIQNYNSIVEYIPQAATGLNIFKNNIQSPDDFTKKTLKLTYEGGGTLTSKEDLARVDKILKELNDEYKIEDLADELVYDSLKDGEAYVAILNMKEEINKLVHYNEVMNLKEGGQVLQENTLLIEPSLKEIPDTKIYAENFDAIDLQAIKEYMGLDIDQEEMKKGALLENALLVNNEELLNEAVQLKIDNEYKETFADLLNERFMITDYTNLALGRYLAEDAIQNGGYEVKTTDLKQGESIIGENKKEKKYKEIKTSGSIIKKLNPAYVIELKIEDHTIGYLYNEILEKEDGDTTNMNINKMRGNSEISGKENISGGNNYGNLLSNYKNITLRNTDENALRKLVKTISKTLGKKLNRNFVSRNTDLKNFIYTVLKNGFMEENSMKIMFIPADKVVKFKVTSVFEDVLFMSKLYIATLMNVLMVKLSRSMDKRVYFVTVGLDQEYQQAVMSVVKDAKLNTMKLRDIEDMQTTVKQGPGVMHDMFIPVHNGQRPIEIDIVPGQDVDINDQFLQYLLEGIIAGMGLPASLLDAGRELEYVRKLAMQNGNFLRRVVDYQKIYAESFSKFFRLLTKNHIDDAADVDQTVKDGIDFKKIKVDFPPPSVLNLTNLSEQLRTTKEVAEEIANTYVEESSMGMGDDSENNVKHKMIKEIMKRSMPALDWEFYDKIFDEVTDDKNIEEVTRRESNVAETRDDLGMGGGMDEFGNMDDGMGMDEFGDMGEFGQDGDNEFDMNFSDMPDDKIE